MASKYDRFKNLFNTMMTPKGPMAEGADMPDKFMMGREKKIKRLSGKTKGGVFDLIYGARKGREAVNEIE